MSDQTKKHFFFRKKSGIAAIIFSLMLASLLFSLLLSLFLTRSTLSLFEKKNLTQSVSIMLDSQDIRNGVANTIQELAPADTITAEQIDKALDSPEVQEALGQFGDDLISSFLEAFS